MASVKSHGSAKDEQESARLREMFDEATAELTCEDREDRDIIIGGFVDRE